MRVFLDAIGCRLNQSELEQIGRQLRAQGHLLVSDPAKAQLAVVNTCTVTARAAADSRKCIRRAARNGNVRVIVTGCWSTLAPEEAASLPGVARVIPNTQKERLVSIILEQAAPPPDAGLQARKPLPGRRGRTRAFIKAQDGCDQHCTYCLTTRARGPSRSRPLDEILEDIEWAIAGGVQEVVLTGVQLGAWGRDLRPQQTLSDLARGILQRAGLQRLRFSSVEPWDIPEGFFALWEDARLCRHLHLPLQSGCAATLRRMGRITKPDEYRDLIARARSTIPGIAITTDIIVGFPGESEQEFEESLRFVRAAGFAGGHVFTYSERPGTPAARLPDRIPETVRKQRSVRMRQAFEELARSFRRSFIGSTVHVLWERHAGSKIEGHYLLGMTDNYLRVAAPARLDLRNTVTNVLIESEDAHTGRLLGRILDAGQPS